MEIVEKVIVMDTETANTLDDPLVYDLGFAVVDYSGKVYESYSYVIAEVFFDKDLMNTAYYRDKIPQYEQDIMDGKRIIATYEQVRYKFKEIAKKYGVQKVFAHNMAFDLRSTNLTIRWLTSSKRRYFLPFGIEICDTLIMARQVMKNNKQYADFCQANGYITDKGKPRFTAEILYRYITNNTDFVEKHTGLEDVLIEKEILTYCVNAMPDVEMHLFKKDREENEPIKESTERKKRAKENTTKRNARIMVW